MDGCEWLVDDVTARIQVLRPHIARGLFQTGAWVKSGLRVTLRGKSSWSDSAVAFHSEEREITRRDLEREWYSGGHIGIEKPADRADCRACDAPIPAGPRPARSHLRVQTSHARPFRGGYRRSIHDDPPCRVGHTFSALQQRAERRCG